MSSLDNLTAKILNDAKEKAAEIVKNAEAQAEEKFNSSLKKIDSRKEDILEAAAKERELISERIKASAGLKARNEKLKAKQTVIERVIGRLKDRLNLNEEEYMNYLRKNIDTASFNENKKLIVKKEYIGRVKNEFPGIQVAEDESVSSGFIIEENGIQENYTFEVKLDFMRDELEVEISKLLFS